MRKFRVSCARPKASWHGEPTRKSSICWAESGRNPQRLPSFTSWKTPVRDCNLSNAMSIPRSRLWKRFAVTNSTAKALACLRTCRLLFSRLVPSRKRSQPCGRRVRMNWLRSGRLEKHTRASKELRTARRCCQKTPVRPCSAVLFHFSLRAESHRLTVRRHRQSIARAWRSSPETKNGQARFSTRQPTWLSMPAVICRQNGRLSTGKRKRESNLHARAQHAITSPETQRSKRNFAVFTFMKRYDTIYPLTAE